MFCDKLKQSKCNENCWKYLMIPCLDLSWKCHKIFIKKFGVAISIQIQCKTSVLYKEKLYVFNNIFKK